METEADEQDKHEPRSAHNMRTDIDLEPLREAFSNLRIMIVDDDNDVRRDDDNDDGMNVDESDESYDDEDEVEDTKNVGEYRVDDDEIGPGYMGYEGSGGVDNDENVGTLGLGPGYLGYEGPDQTQDKFESSENDACDNYGGDTSDTTTIDEVMMKRSRCELSMQLSRLNIGHCQ